MDGRVRWRKEYGPPAGLVGLAHATGGGGLVDGAVDEAHEGVGAGVSDGWVLCGGGAEYNGGCSEKGRRQKHAISLAGLI